MNPLRGSLPAPPQVLAAVPCLPSIDVDNRASWDIIRSLKERHVAQGAEVGLCR